jgi:hypothetical protein
LDVVDADGSHHVADRETAELAFRILRQYEAMRPIYVPGIARVSKTHYPVFYRAAELCKRRGMTAEAFVKTQLEGMAMLGTFWPSAIASEKFERTLTDHNRSGVRSARHYLSQLHIFAERSRLDGPHLVLADDTIQFTPLFRAVMAAKYDLDDIVEANRTAALRELEGVPLAKEIFKGMLEFLDAK